MDKNYNSKNIRSLLTDGFTPEQLRIFCYDNPKFRHVYDQLATNTGKAEIITRLLEYADRNMLLDPLLAWAKEQNPARYEQHQPYYSESTSSVSHQTLYSSSIQNFLEYYLDSDQQRLPFGGRDEELAKLDRWLADPKSPPYLLLTAPAGRGKSALLCHWFDSLQKRADTLVIFVPVSIRFETNRPEVVFTELGVRLARFHGDQNQSADWSPELVSNYLRHPFPDRSQLVIILDGVDEAAGWEVKASLFPATPPVGLRVVVSTRPLADDEDDQNWLHRLGWERSGLACRLNLTLLTQADIADVLKKMGSPLETLARDVKCVAELYKLSEEGDPLLVSLYVEDLQERSETVPRRCPEDLQDIPRGLEGYFSRWWEEQKDLWGSTAPLKEPIVQTLFNLLACALGPLTRADIFTLASSLSERGTTLRT